MAAFALRCRGIWGRPLPNIGLAVVFSLLASLAHAEVIELEGTIKSIDQNARAIAVNRKTPKGEKVVELQVTKKAGDLAKLKPGDSIRVKYDPDLEIVTGFAVSKQSAEKTPAAEVTKGDPITLISKDSLKGWRLKKPLPDPNWLVADGMIVCIGGDSDLMTEADFDDFEMTLEFLLPSKCNSGIYLRDRYELALLDNEWRTQKNEPAPPNATCGAIYGIAPPKVNAYLGPSRWNKLYVRVVGDTVSARLNDKVILEDVSLTEGDEPVTALGPLRIQYHSMTAGAKFRNWVVTPLKSEE